MKNLNFDYLTKAQVEALLECFDFLKNGYQEKATFEVGDLWVIQLQHKRNFRVLRMFIRPDRYKICERKRVRKMVLFESSKERYKVLVNSDATLGVIKLKAGAS